MNDFKEIEARLNVIKALESPKLRLCIISRDNNYEKQGMHLHADSSQQDILNEVTLTYGTRDDTLSGKLPDAIGKINQFIKDTFKPLIDEQKEAIKKLL